MPNRKLHPSDISDEEWSFAVSYLTLVCEDAPQRPHDLWSPRVAPQEARSAAGEAGER